MFDQPGEPAVFEHFQASRSEVKIRNVVRKTMQKAAWGAGLAILAYAGWRMSRG